VVSRILQDDEDGSIPVVILGMAAVRLEEVETALLCKSPLRR